MKEQDSVGNDEPTFGKRLRIARLATGMTLEEAARQIGVSASHLLNAETDRRRLGVQKLSAARALFHLGSDAFEGSDTFAAARRHLALFYDFEVDEYAQGVTIDREGNARVHRCLKGCRPTRNDQPLQELTFLSKVVGIPPEERRTWLAVKGVSGESGHECRSRLSGDRIVHTVTFLGGWRRTDGTSLTIEFDDYVAEAFCFSRSRASVQEANRLKGAPDEMAGCLRQQVPYLVNRLSIEVAFPEGYQPLQPRLEAEYGTAAYPKGAKLDGFTCASSTLELLHGRIVVTVAEPLPTSAFRIVWVPDEKWMVP